MKRVIRTVLAVALVGLGFLASSAQAVDEKDLLPVDQAYVLTAKAITRERVEFTWTIAPGYYLYRHRFSVQPVDSAFKSNPLQLPDGDKHTDQFFGKVETYRKSVTAVQTGAAASDVASVSFKVKYQGCADVGVCYPPQTRVLSVALPGTPVGTASAATSAVAAEAAPTNSSDPLAALGGKVGDVLGATDALPEDQAFRFEAIANSPAELLVRLTPAPGYYLYRDKTSFRLIGADGVSLGAPRWPVGKPHHDEHFGDVIVYFDVAEIPLPLIRSNTAAQTLTLQANFQGCLTDGICYAPMTRELKVPLPAGAGAAGLPDLGAASATTGTAQTAAGGLWLSLVLALVGGLILNLMPCVLPVLSFKALGLAQASRSHAHAQAHALWYTAGVLASFALVGALVLGLRGAGQALGWGFQLQQPGVVGTLALLMFAIGLSLSGLFQFGASLAGVGQSLTEKSGATGDFFTGVLAVVVASPCTAPFMAGALGYAFTAPILPAMLVFLMLGLGLALPFLLIGFVPALASRIPKPGAWMDTLKHWLAYPMYFTAVWLVWVFGKQRGIDALALLLVAAVLLALGLWWFERLRYSERRAGKLFSWLLLAMALGALVLATRGPANLAPSTGSEGTVPFSAKTLAELRAAHTPVFIDMTADWCITCKVNEKAVLQTDEFRALLKRTGTVYMVGDWTNQDPAISAFLDEFKAPGVPLYVLYPADGGPGRKLPQILSQGLMRESLEAAARK
jgi:thiol:disulfide interchange protein DsbD